MVETRAGPKDRPVPEARGAEHLRLVRRKEAGLGEASSKAEAPANPKTKVRMETKVATLAPKGNLAVAISKGGVPGLKEVKVLNRAVVSRAD